MAGAERALTRSGRERPWGRERKLKVRVLDTGLRMEVDDEYREGIAAIFRVWKVVPPKQHWSPMASKYVWDFAVRTEAVTATAAPTTVYLLFGRITVRAVQKTSVYVLACMSRASPSTLERPSWPYGLSIELSTGHP